METARVSERGARRWTERLHPWIYRSDVVQPPAGGPGVVRVCDVRGTVLGLALWSPASSINLRMLTREERVIDERFWADRLARAVAYRDDLALAADAYRLVHAEADRLPSLVVDRYGPYLVVQLLSAGLESCRREIVGALQAVIRPQGILARNDVPVRRYEGLPRRTELLAGEVPERLEVREGAVRYVVEPWTGQKTGAFLDQRENRQRAGALARGRALDCFTYHGSFALHLAWTAHEVVAVDSSGDALRRAADNAALNGLDNIQWRETNAFDFLRAEVAAGARYDLIVLDPPAFAKRRQDVASALRGYKEINLRALRLLADSGILCTFSCSYQVDTARFRAMLESAAADAARPVRWLEAREQAPDHPQLLQIPESTYLKGAIVQAV